MSSLRNFKSVLRQALSAERQAIAIYKAELPLLRFRKAAALPVYAEILEEELQHQGSLEEALRPEQQPGFGWLDRLAGTLFGWILGLLPISWNYWLHAWAEREAAKSYWLARATLLRSHPEDGQLAQTLGRLTRQELDHRKRFLNLMKGRSHE